LYFWYRNGESYTAAERVLTDVNILVAATDSARHAPFDH
jgi:hypothetical protein